MRLRYFVERDRKTGRRHLRPAFAVCPEHFQAFPKLRRAIGKTLERLTRREAERWTRIVCKRFTRLWLPIPCFACVLAEHDRLREQAWSARKARRKGG